jgi:dGTPase
MSRGRVVEEEPSKHRTPYQRDRDRIIHTSAFRRLQYKTQVFVYYQGDHYRNRLSHTIEVSQIARTLARALMVNEDLAEGVALAHDLGHTPFAHMGEDILKVCMKDYGGFYHNDQSLRILTTLEKKYPLWQGLNLTWETLEGVAKHNGPVLRKGASPTRDNLTIALYELSQKMDMELDKYASIEAQVAAIADDIAYNNHDVDDGLRAGFFTIDDIAALGLFVKPMELIRHKYPDIGTPMMVTELIRRMIGIMIEDVLATSFANIKRLNIQSPQDVANAGEQIVKFSPDMESKVDELRKFLMVRMYRHRTIEDIRVKVEKIIPDLFGAFLEKTALLPDDWQKKINGAGEKDTLVRTRIVCDYVAGMTDRFAISKHEELFGQKWDFE